MRCRGGDQQSDIASDRNDNGTLASTATPLWLYKEREDCTRDGKINKPAVRSQKYFIFVVSIN